MATLVTMPTSLAITEYVLVISGSAISELATPTSDLDWFMVGDGLSPHHEILRTFSHCDLEERTWRWLDTTLEQLSAFRPQVNGGISPFSWMDLRFLARLTLGKDVQGRHLIAHRLKSVEEQLRIALATYTSSLLITSYQDAVGLLLSHREDEALAMAGNLVQQACLLALLHDGLVDPAPKWALAVACKHPNGRIRKGALVVRRALGAYGHLEASVWLRQLLNAANALVAAQMLRGQPDEPRLWASSEEPALLSQTRLPLLCAMGVPGFETMMDTVRNQVCIVNRAFLAGLVGLGHLNEVSERGIASGHGSV